MFKYIDKPVEDMTLAELMIERDVQRFLYGRIQSMRKYLEKQYAEQYREEKNRAKDLPDDYLEQYINGIINEEQYKAYRSISTNETVVVPSWVNRMAYLKMVEFHLQAWLDEVNPQLNKVKIESKPKKKRGRPRKRKLPSKYGYNPRKNDSKYNYVRDDWGKTRENQSLHKMRKGK